MEEQYGPAHTSSSKTSVCETLQHFGGVLPAPPKSLPSPWAAGVAVNIQGGAQGRQPPPPTPGLHSVTCWSITSCRMWWDMPGSDSGMCHPQMGLCQRAEPWEDRDGGGRGRSYLVWHHDERVFVFRQKVEETPELEGILVGYGAIPIPVGLVILFCCQGPAELIKVFFDKSTFFHLRAGVRGVSVVLQGYRGGFWEGKHWRGETLTPEISCPCR